MAVIACGDPPAAPTPVEPDGPIDPPAVTTPPFDGTVFISPHVITEADATKLTGVAYSGRGQRVIFDRRVDNWITVNAYLFDVRYSWGNVEFQINPEFGSRGSRDSRPAVEDPFGLAVPDHV
ncbi:MAG: hypothetical protein OXH69_10040 [Acidobacteria bacterium]|nr:hypothetical protein [Acidobacteriota bacterium]